MKPRLWTIVPKAIFILVVVFALFLLAGCSNGKPNFDTTIITNEQQENTVKIFAGIPIALGAEGSAARLNEEWMITAEHNWPILLMTTVWEYYKHPVCDVIVYRSKGTNTVPLGIGYFDDDIVAVGYPMAQPLAANTGRIIGNVNMDSYPECTKVATTAVIAQGMSGGGVYNQKGELIGVVHGFATSRMEWPNGTSLDNGGVYTQLSTIREWLKEITGIEL